MERDEPGAVVGQVADLPLVGLAHVDDGRGAAVVQALLQLGRAHLLHPFPGLRLGPLRRRDAAERLVVDELGDRRLVAAHRAVGVLLELQLAPAHAQRVEEQQPADERLAGAEDQLDGLQRLQRADDPRQHAQHAALGAARHQPRRRRLPEQAAVARPARRVEHRDLALEPEDRAVHVRLAQQHARVVHQVAGREVVRPVHHHVVRAQDLERVLARQPRGRGR